MSTIHRCPECGREAVGTAFHTSALWLRCPLGHVFQKDQAT